MNAMINPAVENGREAQPAQGDFIFGTLHEAFAIIPGKFGRKRNGKIGEDNIL